MAEVSLHRPVVERFWYNVEMSTTKIGKAKITHIQLYTYVYTTIIKQSCKTKFHQ